MSRVALSQLPITDEVAATGEVAATYGESHRVMEIPFVPNIYKAVASSPVVRLHTDQDEFTVLPAQLQPCDCSPGVGTVMPSDPSTGPGASSSSGWVSPRVAC